MHDIDHRGCLAISATHASGLTGLVEDWLRLAAATLLAHDVDHRGSLAFIATDPVILTRLVE
jgi:hypothetical protein